MGHKEKLELEIAGQTQKELQTIKQGLMNAFRNMEMIDSNMRQSHMALMGDLTNLTVRINYIIEFMKKKFPQVDFDAEFKVFALAEREKMQKGIKEAMDKSTVSNEGAQKPDDKKIIS